MRSSKRRLRKLNIKSMRLSVDRRVLSAGEMENRKKSKVASVPSNGCGCASLQGCS
jgi:hypothetical protein